MTFREWLIREAGSNVRNKATGGSGIDQSVLHGYAAQFGRPDTPGPIKKGIDAAVTGVGKGVAAGLDRRGLDVQASPSVLPPEMGGNEEFVFKDANLLLQTPLFSHNNTVQDIGRGINFESSGFIKRIVDIAGISEKIRLVYDNNKIDDGLFHPLYRDKEDSWNYDVQKAKEFTRALMIKLMVENPPPKGFTQEERETYEILSPEIQGEQVKGMYMISVFKFKKKKNAPEILKGDE